MGSYTRYDAADPDTCHLRNFNRVQSALQSGESEESVQADLLALGWPESEARRLIDAQNQQVLAPVDPMPSRHSESTLSSGHRRSSQRKRLPADQSWGCVTGVAFFWLLSGAILAFFGLLFPGEQQNVVAHGDYSKLRIFFGILGCCYLIVGIGVLRMRPWARVPALVLGGMMCLSIPIGTIIGVMFLSAMSKNERNFRPYH